MNLSARDRRAVRLGAIVVAAAVVVRVAVMPWADSWLNAREGIAADGQSLADLQKQLQRALRQRRRMVEAFGPGAVAPLPDAEAAPIRLLQAAQEVLGKGGFKITGYEPQAARPLRDKDKGVVKGVLVVPLQVRGRCQLPQLAQCLDGMKQAKTLVVVDRVVVANDEKKPGQLEVTLLLTTLAEAKRDKT